MTMVTGTEIATFTKSLNLKWKDFKPSIFGKIEKHPTNKQDERIRDPSCPGPCQNKAISQITRLDQTNNTFHQSPLILLIKSDQDKRN